MRRIRVVSCAALAAAIALVSPAVAAAQVPPPSSAQPAAAAKPPREFQIALTAVGVAPQAFDPATVIFRAPDGSPVVISTSQTSVGVGVGMEVHLGFRLARALEGEVSGSFVRSPYRTQVTLDVEDGDLITARTTASQFGVEGAALWTIATPGHTQVFIRGAAGWLLEIADQSLIGDGLSAQVGAGIKYWWKPRVPRAPRRIGIRIEGRVNLRSIGIVDEPGTRRLLPVIVGGVIFGF